MSTRLANPFQFLDVDRKDPGKKNMETRTEAFVEIYDPFTQVQAAEQSHRCLVRSLMAAVQSASCFANSSLPGNFMGSKSCLSLASWSNLQSKCFMRQMHRLDQHTNRVVVVIDT